MIFGFTGKMGTGKTTACEYFLQKPDFVKICFKDGLIKELKERFGPVLDELSLAYELPVDDLFRTKPSIVRKILQCYGTEVRRVDDPNYWVKQWKKEAGKQVALGKSIVCDDVRFLNEAQAVRELGGSVVRLLRLDIWDTGKHTSETEMELIDPDVTISTKKDDFETFYKHLDNL